MQIDIRKKISNRVVNLRSNLTSRYHARYQEKYNLDLSLTEAFNKFPGRNELYSYMHHYFNHRCLSSIKDHRSYFKVSQRGFGEDAFHAMWSLLFKEFKPRRCLEIGVYRGQVVTLWGLLSRLYGLDSDIYGISPFSSAGDEVSSYLVNLNYFEDVMQSNKRFCLPAPKFLKSLSTDKSAVDLIRGSLWDLIYIDGNHDYEVALFDYENCKESLGVGGILVMDDSSLFTDYRPECFSFAGHPGPSRVVKDRAMKELRFLCGVGHNNIFQKIC